MRRLQAQRLRRVHGDAGQRLGHRQLEQRAGHVDHQQQAQAGRGAGVVVGADGHRHTRLAQRVNGRQVRVAQRVIGAGQQHGHAAGGLHRRDAARAEVLQVVARQRAVFGRQCGAVHVAELLGMQLDGQAHHLGRLEDALGLRPREADALAKHIDGIDQPFARQLGHHAIANLVDVAVGAALELGRQRVGAKKGGLHRHAEVAPQPPRHAQLLALVLCGQAVTALDLDGAHAFGQQGLQARRGGGKQLVLAGLARGLHGADDAAAGARDLLVAGAVEPQRELMRALAAVDEVGVAVDQPGRDQRARTVVARPARQQFGRQTIRRAGVDDVPALNGDHAGRRRQLAAQQGIGVQQAQVVPQAVGAERVGWNAIDHVAARAG